MLFALSPDDLYRRWCATNPTERQTELLYAMIDDIFDTASENGEAATTDYIVNHYGGEE